MKPAKPALKFDNEKAPLDLLDRGWLTEVAKVMAFGAKKYARHNWRDGIADAQSRYMAAAMRHIILWNEGSELDGESGLSHLAHASACLMFAQYLRYAHPTKDGRWKG